MALLEVDDISVYYGPSQVISHMDLDVEAGEIASVVGRNGMGKTTLAHSVLGLLRPRSGEIRFDGKEITNSRPERIAAAGITFVPQGRRIFSSLTVAEHLEVARRSTSNRSPFTVEDVCEHFPILGDRWGQRASLLSGGQQQVLALARALVGNGRLIIMDEPSEGLDRTNLDRTVNIIRRLSQSGVSVLLVEQRLAVVAAVADRVHVMERGRILFTTDGAAVRTDPKELVRSLGFGGATER